MTAHAASHQTTPMEIETPSSIMTSKQTDKSSDYSIVLTPDEERLFQVLVAAADKNEARHHPTEEKKCPSNTTTTSTTSPSTPSSPNSPTEIRVAGGWVRDKILHLWSHDIDIALNNMTGVEFAQIVRSHLDDMEKNGEIEHANRKIGVINANPDQSKHLETATMKIFGIEVDFVNLRADEIYLPHSRIPHQTKRFGDPLEDAMRRDFTINSLFFNIRTRTVEDFTERGLDDLLRKKLIETPMCSIVTFNDDPLRVLRAIRFGVRYGFALAEDLKKAAMSDCVKESLMIKVSRERVGKELEGMLTGKGAKPAKALELIVDLGLAESVFGHPDGVQVTGVICGKNYDVSSASQKSDDSSEDSTTIEEGTFEDKYTDRLLLKGWHESKRCLQHLPQILAAVDRIKIDMESHSKNGLSDSMVTESVVDVRMLHLATFLLPFADLKFTDTKEKTHRVVEWMLKESIKFKNKDIFAMETLMDSLPQMRALLVKVRNAITKDDSSPQSPRLCRLETGLILRKVKDLWVTSIVLATVAEMRSASVMSNDKNNVARLVKDILQACCIVYQTIFQQGLDGCWRLRPLLDGRAIISLLNLPKGPIVGVYLEEQVRWMLLNPNGTKEECENHLKRKRMEREEEDVEIVGQKISTRKQQGKKSSRKS